LLFTKPKNESVNTKRYCVMKSNNDWIIVRVLVRVRVRSSVRVNVRVRVRVNVRVRVRVKG
jgi:hypothetical protein